jgi:hypothetical protein
MDGSSVFRLRLDKEHQSQLQQLAGAFGISKAQAMRMAIKIAARLLAGSEPTKQPPVGLPSEVQRDAVSMDLAEL